MAQRTCLVCTWPFENYNIHVIFHGCQMLPKISVRLSLNPLLKQYPLHLIFLVKVCVDAIAVDLTEEIVLLEGEKSFKASVDQIIN